MLLRVITIWNESRLAVHSEADEIFHKSRRLSRPLQLFQTRNEFFSLVDHYEIMRSATSNATSAQRLHTSGVSIVKIRIIVWIISVGELPSLCFPKAKLLTFEAKLRVRTHYPVLRVYLCNLSGRAFCFIIKF